MKTGPSFTETLETGLVRPPTQWYYIFLQAFPLLVDDLSEEYSIEAQRELSNSLIRKFGVQKVTTLTISCH